MWNKANNDKLHGFIIVTEVTAANVPGHKILPSQLDSTRTIFGEYCKEIPLDAGYYNATCARELFTRVLFVSMPYKRPTTKEHSNCKRTQCTQVNETLYACPSGVAFHYKTTTRGGYHEFKPIKNSCWGCPFLKKENTDRVLRVSIHQSIYDQLREMRLSVRGKILRIVRPQTIELGLRIAKNSTVYAKRVTVEFRK